METLSAQSQAEKLDASISVVLQAHEGPRTAPPQPPTLLNYLHSFIAIPLIYLYTIVMGSLSLALSFFDPTGARQHWCARVWSRMITRTVAAPVRVYGAEHVTPGVSYVFLSTHQSYIDISTVLGYIPAQLRIAAKKSVFQIPFLGWHMRRAGHIPIDRASTQNAVANMRHAALHVRNGVCAFIFPEGTRSRDGFLHPFKKGGFKLAIQAGAPIIPVTIINSRAVLPCDSVIFRAGPINMYLDSPIETREFTDKDIERLMEIVRARMLRHFPSTRL